MAQERDPEAGAGDTDRSVTAPGTRASDQERAEVVTALQRAGGEGRLTLEEVDHRTGAAYAARFRHELGPLTADLPAPSGSDAPTGWTAVWHDVLRQSRATVLGVAPDAGATPSHRQQVLGALAALAILIWLALWIIVGFGVGVMG
jgi:hypothetical protein